MRMPGDSQCFSTKGTTSKATYASYIACTCARSRGEADRSHQLSAVRLSTQKSFTRPPSISGARASTTPSRSHSVSSPWLVGKTSSGAPQ